MAHFVRRAAGVTTTTLIRGAAIIPATYAAFSRYPSPAVVRRLMHKDSQFPPAVLRDVRYELNRIEEDCVRRHREFSAELAKLHNKMATSLGIACRYMVCVRVKEMRMEVEANLESIIREKVRVAKAEAFEEGRRSVLLNRKSWRQSEGRHC